MHDTKRQILFKIDKLDIIKVKNIFSIQDLGKKVKKQASDQNTFVKHVTDNAQYIDYLKNSQNSAGFKKSNQNIDKRHEETFHPRQHTNGK